MTGFKCFKWLENEVFMLFSEQSKVAIMFTTLQALPGNLESCTQHYFDQIT
jgi:hypothetical protein